MNESVLSLLLMVAILAVIGLWQWLIGALERQIWPEPKNRQTGAQRVPRCPECRYMLVSVSNGHCPECGVDLRTTGVRMTDEFISKEP